jgi:hypothetical protein
MPFKRCQKTFANWTIFLTILYDPCMKIPTLLYILRRRLTVSNFRKQIFHEHLRKRIFPIFKPYSERHYSVQELEPVFLNLFRTLGIDYSSESIPGLLKLSQIRVLNTMRIFRIGPAFNMFLPVRDGS